jgi:hypothetical protein
VLFVKVPLLFDLPSQCTARIVETLFVLLSVFWVSLVFLNTQVCPPYLKFAFAAVLQFVIFVSNEAKKMSFEIM